MRAIIRKSRFKKDFKSFNLPAKTWRNWPRFSGCFSKAGSCPNAIGIII